MTSKFFIPKPRLVGDHVTETSKAIYRTRSGDLLKWSNEKPLPAIGDQVTVTMNDIGPAIVKGYFSEGGYLGVMTQAINPPAWLKKQRGPNLEQLKAVHAWAKLHGRTWKDKLRQAWWSVNYHGFADSHLLQQVRNQLGPAWLNDYTLDPNELEQQAWTFEGIGCEFGVEIEY